ncbi:mitochondrial ATP synthase epsilon chain-domain-containing protein [Syncephalis pseudoplumigaleata]|uniref:Mitochondrial ATP synthase epsilon chain-domain-containing protein n=1 Tax=Syncephalis pseudoplumigaleata TaxID=1712513 RepID=A0A4P9YTG3_9FUNG|nr:mitochondrial ATP synthase epsilon chain-domain-containing protein [Syncephalis pseudoplumigaleata]RKP23224.1 mitochondrial ATP synthase epsilon chain-domain-containing protein [Syncephalis pseudoplumigaleata]|eukprot:RKP23216.1 mitochondrial ATP synthase epsilon chain-domain-containing protein [Syncephalis pseudoplumigaleata]
MAFSWKAANISYLQYSIVCARAVRNSLKPDLRAIAQRRDEQGLKFQKWQGGKAGDSAPVEVNKPPASS